MQLLGTAGRVKITLGIGLALFAFALTFDLGTIRSHTTALHSLQQQREQAHRDLTAQLQRRQDCRRLASLLGVDDLSQIARPEPLGPVAYLNELLSESGVKTLDLAVTGEKRFPRLRRTDLLVRAAGDFPSLVRFVRELEQGRRLASIEDFEIQNTLDSKDLEGRFNLALYDPLVAPEEP